MLPDLHTWYLTQPEPAKSSLLALRTIILSHDTNITETRKYGMPCFCYQKNILCYLWTDRKTGEPYILLAEGRYIDHPQLEEGDRSRMKIFRVDAGKDLPVKTIQTILKKALGLYQTGMIQCKK